MKRYAIGIALLMFLVPLFSQAQDVQLTAGATIEITLTSPSVTYTLSSTTGINTLAVSNSTLTLTLDSGDNVTVTQDNGYVITNDLSAETQCLGSSTRITFTQTVVITSGSTLQNCRSGGSGGNPPADVSIQINNGALQTTSRTVTLQLHAGNASEMIVSNMANFADALWGSYSETKTWTLTEGVGEKRVYINYRSSSGDQSAPLSAVIQLVGALTPGTPSATEPARPVPTPPQTPGAGVAVLSEGMLVKGSGINVYLISQGKRHWIYNEAAFNQRRYRWEDIRVVSDDSLNSYADGSRIEFTAIAAYTFRRYLALGSAGEDVRALQRLLQTLGFFPQDLKDTGYFGPITRSAVIDFQKANGIAPVGVVGPLTRAALNRQ